MTPDEPRDCRNVSEIRGQIGEKWTMQVVVALRDQPRRFNDIRRNVNGLSPQMLTRTLKTLERDGWSGAQSVRQHSHTSSMR